MARTIELTLRRRGATCAAELLEVAAPRTCDAIWDALPIVGPLWHTKTAGSEVYTLLPAFSASLPIENGSLVPLPGDLLFFAYPGGTFPPTDPRWIDIGDAPYLACIGSFYERNSIHWMELGFVPGSRWGRIVEGLKDWQTACQDVWLNGCEGEHLELRRTARR